MATTISLQEREWGYPAKFARATGLEGPSTTFQSLTRRFNELRETDRECNLLVETLLATSLPAASTTAGKTLQAASLRTLL